MTSQEALAIAWAIIDKEQKHDVICGLANIRLSTAEEVRDVLGESVADPNLRDVWYVSFWLRLDEDVVEQHPDTILITIDDKSKDAAIVWQM